MVRGSIRHERRAKASRAPANTSPVDFTTNTAVVCLALTACSAAGACVLLAAMGANIVAVVGGSAFITTIRMITIFNITSTTSTTTNVAIVTTVTIGMEINIASVEIAADTKAGLGRRIEIQEPLRNFLIDDEDKVEIDINCVIISRPLKKKGRERG